MFEVNRLPMRLASRLVLLCFLACAPESRIVAQQPNQEFRVLVVGLLGEPVSGIDVRVSAGDKLVPDKPNPSGSDGIATVPIDVAKDKGELKILVNLGGAEVRDTLDFSYIGRRKKVAWNERDRFYQGFAVPVWAPGDVKGLTDVIISNPDHILVAVQRPRTPGGRPQIITRLRQNVDEWASYWAPDVPRVRSPELAWALFEELKTGDEIPVRFDAALQPVFDEVDRQNAAARFCRQQVAAGLFPPPANNQPPPDDNQPPPDDNQPPPDDMDLPPDDFTPPPEEFTPPPQEFNGVSGPPPEEFNGVSGPPPTNGLVNGPPPNGDGDRWFPPIFGGCPECEYLNRTHVHYSTPPHEILHNQWHNFVGNYAPYWLIPQ